MSESLYELEVSHARSGEAPDLPSIQAQNGCTYYSRLIRNNYLEAKAITQAFAVHSLESARTLIATGEIQAAKNVLAAMDATGGSDSTQGQTLEVDLELFRIAYFEGNWLHCSQLGRKLLEQKNLWINSRYVTLQILSEVAYRLGNSSDTEKYLLEIDGLNTLLPHHPAKIYAKITRIKHLVRTDAFSRENWKNLLDDLKSDLGKNPDANALLSYFRLKSELQRLAKADPTTSIFSSYALATLMGDRLYAFLALKELSAHFPKSQTSLDWRKLEIEFPRFASEIHFTDTNLEESTSMLYFNRGAINTTTLEQIIWTEESWKFSTKTLAAKSIKISERISAVAQTLSLGPVQENELFRSLYPNIRYSPEKHLNGIRTLLSRARKELGLTIVQSHHQIALQNYRTIIL
jgi:hypothetical protein